MRSKMVCVAVISAWCVSCGDSDPLPYGYAGGGGLFPGLSGEYLLDDGCVLRLNGSSGAASCSSLESDSWGEWSEASQGSLTIQETRITFSGTHEMRYVDYEDSMYNEYSMQEASGEATRIEGRQSDGRFSAIAGEWTGSISWTESGDYPDAATYGFAASVYGDTITVTWTSSSGPRGQFSLSSDAGGVWWNGEYARAL